MKTDYIQVTTTAPTQEEAVAIAERIVTKRLSACVQVSGPVISVYHWKGTIERESEWICVCKTTGRLFQRLEKEIKTLHSYETPEIVAVPIVKGSDEYLKWLSEEVSPPPLSES